MPLYYEYDITSRSDYRHTNIRVYSTDTAEPIEKTIAGCVGNAAGYQSAEIAERLLGEFTGLRDRGATGVLRWLGDARLTVSFQHYREPLDGDWNRRETWAQWEAEPKYCAASFELPSTRGALKSSHEMLLRLERNMLRHGALRPWDGGPCHLLSALARLRAARVYRMTYGQYGSDLCTVDARTAQELEKTQWSLAS